MKKTLYFFLAFSFFFVGGVSSASAATCGDPKLNHAAYDVYPPSVAATTTVPAIDNVNCDSGNPYLVMNAWGLTGNETPFVRIGEKITDEHGFSVTCDKASIGGCYDLTKTDYYRNQMFNLAKQIIATGQVSRFPMFSGWYNAVR